MKTLHCLLLLSLSAALTVRGQSSTVLTAGLSAWGLNTYYVSASTGSDSTNDGSIAEPFASISQAQTVATNASNIIYVLDGVFNYSGGGITISNGSCQNYAFAPGVVLTNAYFDLIELSNTTVTISGPLDFYTSAGLNAFYYYGCSNLVFFAGTPQNPLNIVADGDGTGASFLVQGSSIGKSQNINQYIFTTSFNISAIQFPKFFSNSHFYVSSILPSGGEALAGTASGPASYPYTNNCTLEFSGHVLTFTGAADENYDSHCKIIFNPMILIIPVPPSESDTNTYFVFRDVEAVTWPTNLEAAGNLSTNSFTP